MPTEPISPISAPGAKPANGSTRTPHGKLFSKTIPISRPTLPPTLDLLERLGPLLSQAHLTNGQQVADFETEAAEYLGVGHCVAVSSCTSGLILTARCLGLTGEVIVPSYTFFASAHSLEWNGLTPVLADCDPQTFTLDPASAEHLITPRTSAILGVHIYGCPAQVDALERLAARAGLKLIFDAAHAFGARAGVRPVAARGVASVYSLTPTKPLVAGEGGLVATDDGELAAMLRRARNYGKGDSYDCDILGLNARLTEMQAVLARCGLPLVEEGVRRRNEIASAYERVLASVPGIRLQKIPAGWQSSRKDFAIVIDEKFGMSRARLEAELSAENVETRRYFDPPLHRQSLYGRYYQPKREPLTHSERISSRVLCLPIFTGMAVESALKIANRIAQLGAMARAGELKTFAISAEEDSRTSMRQDRAQLISVQHRSGGHNDAVLRQNS